MYFLITISLIVISYLLSKKNVNFRKLSIFLTSSISIIYILWRLTTIPTNSPASFTLGTILYIAEIVGLSQFFIFQFLFIRNYKLEKKTLNDYKDNLPYIDIFICTYNENSELLEKTIIASKNIIYTKNKVKIHVCDDGKRQEIKKLCEKHNINWITRNGNEGAKAGNINNALKLTDGDLFVVLDADMIPNKKFLLKTVGYFDDINVAFVQTPQVYYNKDMYQYNLKKSRPNEQDFFMRDIQEARASINAVLHVGTNAIFRRKHVEISGGYPTFSITEDMAVGLKLQELGYTGVFINEPLVLGLSATTYTDLISQRDRWCRGNLQVLKHINLFKNKYLTLPQKIAYFDGVLYWFSSLQKMIYMISPLVYLLSGILIVKTSAKKLISMFTPFFIGQMLIFKTLSSKTRTLKWSHFYEVAMAPHISLSIIKELFGLKIKFNVTPKDNFSDKGYFQLNAALPHIIMIILSILSFIVGINGFSNGSRDFFAILINCIWTIYNMVGLLVCIYVAYQKPIKEDIDKITLNKKINCYLIDTETNEKLHSILIDINDKALRIDLLENTHNTTFKNNKEYILNINNIINEKVTINKNNKNTLIIKYEHFDEKAKTYLKQIYIENIKPYFDVERMPHYIDRTGKEITIKNKSKKQSTSA